MRGKLRRKPLLEAIFELKWDVPTEESDSSGDPDYSFLIGLFQNALRDTFPYAGKLPAAQIPIELARHIAQYQFRVAKDQWPLAQLGPGVVTVNETQAYEWEGHFEAYCKAVIHKLRQVHPRADQLSPQQAQLRFINALYLDDDQEILPTLSRKLKTQVSLPDELLELVPRGMPASGMNLGVSFPMERPESRLAVSFNRGKAHDRDAIVWEVSVVSDAHQLETFFDDHESWLDNAHDVAEAAFFGFLSDQLLEEFGYEPGE